MKPWEGWFNDMRRNNEDLWKVAKEGNATKMLELLSFPSSSCKREGSTQACVDARSVHGFTALHMAATAGHSDCVEILVSVRADLDARTDRGFTPLHLASQLGHVGVSRVLLDAGCDARAQGDQGDLPLHLAAASAQQALLPLLLQRTDAGSLHTRNHFGLRPLDLCVDIGTAAVFAGAGVLTDPYVRTAFPQGSVLLRNSRADAVRRLLRPGAHVLKESPDLVTVARRRRLSSFDRTSPRAETAKGEKPRRFATLRAEDIEDVGPGSFKLKAVLGKGSFGEVYKVMHRSSGNVYAMKVLRKSKVMGRNLVRYAVTERNLLSYIRHPFIVRLHFAFQTPGSLVLVLHYCPNGNIASLIKQCKRLSNAVAVFFLAEVLLAVEYLHDRNVVYRDMKPENVVLDEANHAMLTDFGLSKEGVEGLTGTTSFCGSTAYLAPEILSRRGHGTPVDIYGMGAFLYEMLCGITPYFNRDKNVLLRNIAMGRLHVPEIVSEVSESLIRMLMCKDPAKRLGAHRTSDIRSHAAFEGLDFEKVLKREVPVPALNVSPGQKDSKELRMDFRMEAQVWGACSSSQQDVEGWEFSEAVMPVRRDASAKGIGASSLPQVSS